MFEKANPVSASLAPGFGGRNPVSAGLAERFESLGPRRAGDALRVVEWTEITTRLKAARDLRLLLRTESLAPIEAVAASFGDAAASYFALLDDNEPSVNPNALEQSKALGATHADSNANRPGEMADNALTSARGDAREMQ
ncbi:MAG: hypothetical protein HC870_01065 [Rhizobiales bacterium]|nr:hypothetical protein [Hyphomicrobiales bacterium]